MHGVYLPSCCWVVCCGSSEARLTVLNELAGRSVSTTTEDHCDKLGVDRLAPVYHIAMLSLLQDDQLS